MPRAPRTNPDLEGVSRFDTWRVSERPRYRPGDALGGAQVS